MGFEGKSFHMVAALLGKKVGMTRVYTESGEAVPVTVIQAGPCSVLATKSAAGTDKYDSVQLGFDDVKPHRSTLPMIGHAAKAGTGPKRFIREVRMEKAPEANPGDVWTVEVFESAQVRFVDVIGTTRRLSASIVRDVGSKMSITRLCVRISNCSRDFLSI